MSRYAAAHANPQGPGDARPTALQIIQDEGLANKLAGKVALVTGANVSIGLETARALHATGATVYIGARSVAKGEAARKDILDSDPSNTAPVHVLEIQLDSFESIRKAAKEFREKEKRLNLLVLNAGVMATPEGRTKDGFETQFGTNHLGHFLLFQLLKDLLLAGSTPEFNSRVVSVSSIGHRGSEVRFDDYNFEKSPYDPWVAYGQAKTANIYLANEIDRRYGPRGLHALALHPGGIWSNLLQHVDPSLVSSWRDNDSTSTYMKSPAQGASTSVYAAVSKEWEGRGGRFLSNCVEQKPSKPGQQALAMDDDGYAPWAFDEEKARRLWRDSCKFVGVEDDE